MKKFISLLLTFCIMLSCVSSVSAADIEFSFDFTDVSIEVTESDEQEATDTEKLNEVFEEFEEVSFDEFANNLMEMIIEQEDIDTSIDGLISDSSNIYFSSGNNTIQRESTNRLIVKSSEAIDKLNSTACVSGYNDLYILQFSNYEDCLAAYDYYSSLDYVQYVQEDEYLKETSIDDGEVFTEATVNYSTQYQSDYFGYSDAKANMATGEVVIAVVDSGVQYDHERLVGRVEPTGFDSVNNKSCYDTRGHGTHVAGIIAANTKENVIIRPYKVLNDEGEGTDTQVYLGILAAIEDDVDIINLSLTKRGDSEILREAIAEAYAEDITVVVAAGNANENLSTTTYSPSSFPEVICAVSVDTTRYKASTSNWGSSRDLSAPGVNILSTYLNNTYKSMSGTSMAAPYISCAAAYLLAYDNTLTPDEVYTTLYNNTVRGGGTHNIRYVTPGALIRNTTVTATPVFEIEAGEFLGYLNVIISCNTANSEILYRTDDMADGIYLSYTGPFRIDETETITAYAISAGNKDSSATKIKYTKSNVDSSMFIIDDEGYLIGYTGSDETLTVPQYCNGYVVKGIAESAFSNNKTIKEITFSKYVKIFDDYAFSGCTSLEKVIAPGVTTIYSNTFEGCSSLSYIELTSISDIPDNAFSALTKLATAKLTALKTIGDRAFYDCVGLSTVNAPNLTTIGNNAFENSALTTLTATNLTSIGNMAFYKSNITSVTYNYVMFIGDYAFSNCKKLTSAKFNNLQDLDSEFVFQNCEVLTTVSMSKVTSLPSYTFYNCPALTSVTLTNVASVATKAFYKAGITSITLPNATTIENSAFSNCTSLENVTLAALTTFNPEYFTGCNNIKSFSLNGVTNIETYSNRISEYFPELEAVSLKAYTGTIPAYAFADCGYLSDVNITSATAIGDYAFYGTAIEEIAESCATTLGNNAFGNNTALTYINFGALKTFNPAAFNGCTNLETIYIDIASIEIANGKMLVDYLPGVKIFRAKKATEIPDYFFKNHQNIKTVTMINIDVIGKEAFMNSTIEEPCFDALEVGDRAFAYCTKLKYVDLPWITKLDTSVFEGSEEYIYEMGLNRVTEIYESDYETFNFSKFTSLELINLESLTVIPKNCFKGCTSLQTLYIDKVTKIGDGAFEGCTALNEIDIPLVTVVGKGVFKDCTALKSFHADGISSIDADMFKGCTGLKSLSLNSIVYLPVDESGTFSMAGIDNLEYFSANSISAIPNNFLRGYSKLKTVSFAGARSIGDYAFYGTSIETFEFNTYLISIGDYAFAGTSIKEIYASNYLEYIGDYAFADCKNLTTVTLYRTEEIGEFAFKDCIYLATFRASAISDPEQLPVNAFSGCVGLSSITLDSIEYLPVDDNGNTYISYSICIDEFIANNITEIPDNYFNSKNVIYIECDAVKHIGNNAFRESSVETVLFPNLETIGSYAFYNSSLEEASFDKVTKVGDYAFAECDQLETILFFSDKIELGEGAFMNDEILWKIRIPSSTSISDKCFMNCIDLSEIYVNRTNTPVTLKAIGDKGFYNCTSLASSEINLTSVKYLGDYCLTGTLIQENNQLAGTDFVLPYLKYIGYGVFDRMSVSSIELENVENVLSIPSADYVLIGSDVEEFDVPYADTIVFAPSYTVVGEGCSDAGIPYRALDSDESFLVDVAEEVDPIDGELEFVAVGFDLKYQWYGCNKEDRSDSVLIYQTQQPDENFFVPLDYLYNDYDEYDYRYYYCVAISVENGNVVYIKSGLSSNTFVQVTGTELTTVDYNYGVIYTNSTDNLNNTESIFSSLGDNIEIIPSVENAQTTSYGTGTVIRVMAVDVDDEVIKEYVLVVYGDVNGDGVIDALDAQQIAAYNNNVKDFDNRYYKMAADLNGSDSIDVEDYQAVINKVVA